MSNITQEERDTAVYVLPAGYSENEFEMSEDEIAFNAFKEEAIDNENYSKITVSRVPMNRHGQRGSQKLHFLFECAVDEYTYSQLLSKLRDEYKSGFYKIQARNEKGQLKLNKTVAVEAPHIDTDTASGDGGTGAIIEQFSRSLADQNAEMRDFMQGNSQGSNDPVDTIIKIAAAVAPILTALGISRPEPAPPPRSLTEQLTEYKIVKELFGDNNEGFGGEANMWTAMAEGLKAFGGPIAAALAKGSETGELNDDGVVNAPALAAPEGLKVMSEQEKHDIAMRKNIHILIQNAKTEIPPDAFAAILVNNTPEEKQDELWEFISNEKCVDTIIEIEPAAEPYRDWFDKLREAVIELMSEPENEDLQPGDDDDTLLEPVKGESETVAGVEDGAAPPESDSASGKSDGDTTDDT